ncbi:hypothetical protein Trydic_g19115 [Trypoxylus dichotomus]
MCVDSRSCPCSSCTKTSHEEEPSCESSLKAKVAALVKSWISVIYKCPTLSLKAVRILMRSFATTSSIDKANIAQKSMWGEK